jgi:hypothetical protein
MWVRGAAIRPVPRWAIVASATLEEVERELGDDSPAGRDSLDAAFARFECTQPNLADAVSQVLARPLDETALALGYFLSIAIWLAFERTFGPERLRIVTEDALQATREAIALEEELRAADGQEPFDMDDVVSTEQPNVLRFVHEHVDSALDPAGSHGGQEGERGREVDVDDVHSVYRAIVLLTLCLSHAVVPVDASRGSRELMA